MKPARTLIGGVATVAVVGLTLSLATCTTATAAPGASASAPSWSDVQAAKASQAATQTQIDAMTASLQSLQDTANDASIASQQAGESYSKAVAKQQDAQNRVDTLDRQSTAAAAKATASAQQVAGLVVELSRTGGGDLSTTMLTDGADAKDLLYKVGAMSHLSERSAGILAQAETDQRQVSALQDQATAAKDALKSATASSKSSLDDANAAAAASAKQLAGVQSEQSTLYDQLAFLKGTTAATEAAYFESQQAAKVAATITGPTTTSSTTAPTATTTAPSTTAPTGGTPVTSTPTTKPTTTPSAPATTAPAPSTPAPSTPAPSTPAPSTPAPTPSKGAAALAFATAQIGKPYQLGAQGPNAYDCSGLVRASYAAQGVATGGYGVGQQYNYFKSLGRLVPRSQAQPGDIIFYADSSGFYHDTIYAGGGYMVEAPHPGANVRKYFVYTADIQPMVARPTGSL